jgi:ribonuclease E
LLPVYAGPTPADPFGGRAFDIFDVMDQVERAAEAQPAPRAAPAVEVATNALPEPEATPPEPVAAALAVLAEPAGEPDAQPAAGPERAVVAEPLAEAAAAAAAEPVVPQPEPAIVNTAAPEPMGEPMHANGEDQAPVPANDISTEMTQPEPPPADPAIKPILIGADGEQPAERKRGWWRR